MADVLQASAPSGTNTTKRGPADTETPRRREAPADQAHARAQGDSPIPVHLLKFESASHVYGIALGRNDEFIVLAPDDRESAILKTPGANLSSRLQRVLPLVTRYTPLAGSSVGEVMDRLWRCHDLLASGHVRSPASTQVKLSADKWMAQVRAWASSHPQRDRVIDDSRESIYGDRG